MNGDEIAASEVLNVEMDTNPCVCGDFCSIFTVDINIQRLVERHHVEITLPEDELLERWALFDCPLAKLVMRALHLSGNKNSRKEDRLKIRFRRADAQSRPIHDLRLLTLHVNDRQHCYLGVYTTSDDPAARYIYARPVDPDPLSPENLAKHFVMLADCMMRHEKCPSMARNPVLPTRVLDLSPINGQADPKLHLSHSEQHAYVTLSYCWGGPQPFATRAENLNFYLQRIPMENLPQSIKDAVFMTKKLGFRYLWVDSLCIIQDSAEDKAREIGTMARTFKDSVLTLSAACASNCSQGFLGVSQDLQNRQWAAFQLPYRCPDGVFGNIHVSFTSFFKTASKIPINSRAWTYQENLLSPRVISYYSDGFEWKCPSAQYSNNGLKAEQVQTIRQLRFGLYNRNSRLPPIFFSSGEDTQPLSERTIEDLHRLWLTIVTEYTFGRLSFLEDKLPAIGGIASEYQRVLGDVYLAGLWKSRLTEGLMWYIAEPLFKGQAQPSAYRAPSWSWAAVEGMVSFGPIEGLPTTVQIEHCEVTPVSDLNPFGQVSSGCLVLRGPLRRLSFNEAKDHFDGRWNKIASSALGAIFPDRVGEPFEGALDNCSEDSNLDSIQKYLWFLQLSSATDEKGSSELAGLVLIKIAGMEFRRVGFFSMSSKVSAEPIQYQQRIKRWESTHPYEMQMITIF